MRLTLLPRRRQSDETLMADVATGSEQAFAELYRRYARRLQGFFASRTADADAAADLVQELFARLWAARRTYRPAMAVTPWLFTLAYNLVRNERRHHDVVTAYAEEARHADEATDEVASTHLDGETLDRALAEILATLSPDDRTLFALRFEEELALADIATVMGIPVGTVKSRLHRLTRALREKLKAYE